MGAVKSIPIVGEVATVVESGSKTVAAAACAVVGKTDTAGRLIKGAGDAWVDWSERSALPVVVRLTTAIVNDDNREGNRVADKFLGSVGDAADGIPVVGHIKGGVHYAMGDNEKGHNSMKAATRTTVVAGACVATGGLAAGAGMGLGATVGVGAAVGAESGLLYDGTMSIAQSAAAGEEKLYGTFAGWDNYTKTNDANDFMDAALGHVGDGIAGAMEAAGAHKGTIAKQSKKTANNLAKNIGEEGARQAMDLARDIEPTVKKAGNKNVVASRVIDRETGQHYDGVNRQTRRQVRTNENIEQGMAKRSARNRAREDSNLLHRETALEQRARQNVTENGQPVRDLMRTAIMEDDSMPMAGKYERLPSSCAEQQAYHAYFESLGDRASDVPQPPLNTRVVTIRITPEGIETMQRCNNCRSFTFEMGECPTDRAGPTPVLPSNVYFANLAKNNRWIIVPAGMALGAVANLDDPAVDRLPPQVLQCGVYFGWANVDNGPVHAMVTSIGWNPHFKNRKKTIETHILHAYDSDFYGSFIKIAITTFCYHWLQMKSFKDMDEIITAINEDIRIAKQNLATVELLKVKSSPYFTAGGEHAKL